MVMEKAGEQARLGGIRLDDVAGAVVGKRALHLLPQRRIDDRRMLAGMARPLVDDLAAIEAVLQQAIEGGASERGDAAAAAGMENKAICAAVGTDANTLGKWRHRFAEDRLDGLLDRRFGLIRRFLVTDAAAHDGHRLPARLNPDAFDSRVWADTGYRSAVNERAIIAAGRVSMVHFRKPLGQPMPAAHRRANRARSVVRAKVEHPFADQESPMGLFVRTIGQARAEMKVGMANLAYNFRRLVWHQRKVTFA